MFEQILAIIRNTFFESIRQPVVVVILVIAALMIILANPLSSFTMENDQRMFLDMGLASIFLCATILAAFIATSVLTREIDNRTALTIISKPVGRPLFILGKFLGVAGALLLATLNMSFIFMLVELHEVRQRVMDPYHAPVLVFGIGAAVLSVGAAVWANYFYDRVFSSSLLCLSTPLLGVAYGLCLLYSHDFQLQPIAINFRGQIWLAIIALIAGILVLTSIAIAVSTRAGQVMTIVVTCLIFVGGMLSDYAVGRQIRSIDDTWTARAITDGEYRVDTVMPTELNLTAGQRHESILSAEEVKVPTVELSTKSQGNERVQRAAFSTAYALLPNFQVFWLADALTQNHRIPGTYIWRVIGYGAAYSFVALGIGVILFQRREVG